MFWCAIKETKKSGWGLQVNAVAQCCTRGGRCPVLIHISDSPTSSNCLHPSQSAELFEYLRLYRPQSRNLVKVDQKTDRMMANAPSDFL